MEPYHRPIALITGTSSGFGMLTAVALAKKGFQVFAAMRSLDRRGPLVQLIKEEGVSDHIELIQMDVTDPLEIKQVVNQIVDRFKRIDVLINNAGYAAPGFVEEVSLDDWRKQFETNFFGVVSLTQTVLPFMRNQRKGTIINMSSISGRMGFPALGPYVSSKFALEGFSESLRLEMAPFGVHVVLIEPGSYQTEIWRKGLEATASSSMPDYHPWKERIRLEVEQTSATAGNPHDVIRLIEHVLQTKHPKLRYPIGKGVKAGMAFKALLPWNWFERIMVKQLRKEKNRR